MYLSPSRLILGALLAAESVAAVQRHQRRKELYAASMERARRTGRRLVIIGAPQHGAWTSLLPAYGCGEQSRGDVCVDLRGCPECPNSITVDLAQGRVRGVEDDSAVVFVSCVLEYVPDLQAAWREILRMAGTTANVFVVRVQPWSLSSNLYPGARWKITEGPPPGSAPLEARPVTTTRKVIAAVGLAGLTYLAIKND